VAVGLTACAFGLAACGGHAPTVDHRQIERQLLDTIKEQKPDVVATAACPPGLKAVKGASFECQLRLGSDSVRYTVTISNVHGAQYDADTRPTEPVLDTSVISSTVRTEAGGAPAGAKVLCGSHRFVQLPVRGTVICTVTLSGQTSAVAATITDEGGDVSLASAAAGAVAGTTSDPQPSPPGPPSTPAPAPSLPGD
jgi:hypothetical protein